MKLSLDDLEGSEVVSSPGPAPAGKLTADDIEGSEVVSTPAVDMSPAARRARAGRPAAGGAVADVDPGLDLRDAPGPTSFIPSATPFAPGSHEALAASRNLMLPPTARQGVSPGWHGVDTFSTGTRVGPDADPLATMVSSGLVGSGAGSAASGTLRALGVGATPANIVGGAVGGGVGSKAAGGDFATGAALGAVLPAAAGVKNAIGGAAARTRTAAKQGLTTGEQNAGKRLTEKLGKAGGADDQFIDDLMARHPELERVAAIKGKTNPGKVAEVVDDTIASKGAELDQLYGQMVKAQHVVRPPDILKQFDAKIGDALASGDQTALRILRQERAQFSREYKNYGALSPDTLRGLKSTAGQTAFGGAPTPAPVKSEIWKVYADAVEEQAKGSGIDPAKLRQLGKDTQILMAAKRALDERELMRKAGRLSIGEHAKRAAMVASGDAGAIKAVVGPPVLRTVGEAGRRIDAGIGRTAIGRMRPSQVDPRLSGAAAALGLDDDRLDLQ